MAVHINVSGKIGVLTMDTLPLFERICPFMSEVKLSELKQDSRNANKGSARGQTAIETSLQKYGAARSIVMDRDGVILCGNHTAEAAATVGLDESVIVVQTTGEKLVAVQRMDLSADDPKARELAYADNRSGEISLSWDAEVLKEDFESGELDLGPFFTESEIESFTKKEEGEWVEEPENLIAPEMNHRLKVDCLNSEQKEELALRLESEGFRVMR